MIRERLKKQLKLGGNSMRTIKVFFMCVIAFTFMACSAESNSFEDSSSNFESMISLYGIEFASNDMVATETPSVTAEEMASVLEALRQNSNTVRSCGSESVEGYYDNGSDRKMIKMTADYQARTRNGAFLEQFALCVSLNFNVDKNKVSYIGTTYSSSTDLFKWQGHAASLVATINGGNAFSAKTFLYFCVSDQENCLVKVPVNFKGDYNFETNQGTYSFTLNASK